MNSLKIKPLRAYSSKNINEGKKIKIETTKGTHSPGKRPTFSLLNEKKSEGDFYSNFRKKTSLLMRVFKEKAIFDRNMKSQSEIHENIERIKTQNEFCSIICDMKKDFTADNSK